MLVVVEWGNLPDVFPAEDMHKVLGCERVHLVVWRGRHKLPQPGEVEFVFHILGEDVCPVCGDAE